MIRKKIKILIILYLSVIRVLSLAAQEGEAGRESIFSIGIGARALGLGSAQVAFPEDASSFYWNPAGMVVVQKKSVGFSLTTLFEGTQYNYLGYVHPTLNFGSFGIGVARIGTDGIKQIEQIRGVPVEIGEMSYWWGRLMIAYGLNVVGGLAIGVNLNVERQVLGTYSTNGFGVDVGLHFRFGNRAGILKDLSLGCNFINALSPRLKLGVRSERIPYMIRTGIAKSLFLRGGKDRIMILADIDYQEDKDIKYHVGIEYGWSNAFFVRAGLDNGELCFGGGLRYKTIQIDYASSRIADPEFFARSHRFTLIYYIGKSLEEQRRILEQIRGEEIKRMVMKQEEERKKRRIKEALNAGKEFLNSGDYFNARLEFAKVLREDENNQEALALLKETRKKEELLQKQREAELLNNERAKEKVRQDNQFVKGRLDEGLEFLKKQNFQKAIERWEEALQRDPENPILNKYIKQARKELEDEVNRLISRARQMRRQDNISEAYQLLNRADKQTSDIPVLNQKVKREILQLNRIVDFQTNFQEGQKQYNNGNYEEAVRYFKKALDYFPDDVRAKEFYRSALARSKGRKKMSKEARVFFNRGIEYYKSGLYEKALQEWEKALKIDPYNIYLLKAVDQVKKKLKTIGNNNTGNNNV